MMFFASDEALPHALCARAMEQDAHGDATPKLYSYHPRPDASLLVRDLVVLLVEVDSQSNGADRMRLLKGLECAVRAQWLLRKKFAFCMGCFFGRDWTVNRYIATCDDGKKVRHPYLISNS